MVTRTPRTQRPAGPPPDQAALREAALAHLARFSATERGLAQVLERRISRWGRRASESGTDASEIAEITARLMPLATSVARTMVELGVINDSSFAKARATRLSHSGQSRRAIEARLAAKGIATSTVSNVLNVTLGSDERARESELGAALVFARKRRAGPFSVASPDESADRQKNEQRLLMAFARAGFARDIAMQALTTDREEAEDRIIALKDAL